MTDDSEALNLAWNAAIEAHAAQPTKATAAEVRRLREAYLNAVFGPVVAAPSPYREPRQQ